MWKSNKRDLLATTGKSFTSQSISQKLETVTFPTNPGIPLKVTQLPYRPDNKYVTNMLKNVFLNWAGKYSLAFCLYSESSRTAPHFSPLLVPPNFTSLKITSERASVADQDCTKQQPKETDTPWSTLFECYRGSTANCALLSFAETKNSSKGTELLCVSGKPVPDWFILG